MNARPPRPSFLSIYMELAKNLAQRSTCRRLWVGAVIATPDARRILSVGYNGNAHGLKNDCDSDEPGKCGCLHAEENAIIKAPPDEPKVVICTHLPCVMCAKRIIQVGGVQAVHYGTDYRLRDAVAILEAAKIPVHKLA